MNEYVRKVRDFWDSLDPREQHVAMAVGGIAMLFLLYVLMGRPLQNKVETLESANARMVRDYQTISAYVPSGQGKGQQENADRTASLEKAIDRVSKDYGLKVSKINRSGESANIEVGTTDTVTLFYFLNELEKKYAVFTQSIEIEPGDNNTIRVRKLTVGRNEKK